MVHRMFISRILSLIFPPRQSSLLVRAATTHDIHLAFTPRTQHRVRTLAPYRDPLISACVKEAKFHHNPAAAALLASLFLHWYNAATPHYDFLIPVPLSRARYRGRGHNQVTTVLEAAARSAPLPPLATHALYRTRNTHAQTSLPRAARMKNVAPAFQARAESLPDLQGATVLLVDDVVTTGATLRHARRALLQAGVARVDCLAFAG